jgi:hypothetical protein
VRFCRRTDTNPLPRGAPVDASILGPHLCVQRLQSAEAVCRATIAGDFHRPVRSVALPWQSPKGGASGCALDLETLLPYAVHSEWLPEGTCFKHRAPVIGAAVVSFPWTLVVLLPKQKPCRAPRRPPS